MTLEDTPAVAQNMRDAFSDLDRRLGHEREGGDLTLAYPRIRHLITTDPGGAWVAEVDGRVAGSALALLRDGLWGLSLLVVVPEHQSAGLGRDLLRAALAYGDGARAGIILASEDSRALRVYSRAGFDLRPGLDAVGPVKVRPPAPAGVRPGRWPQDRALIDRAGEFVRGAGHGRDVPTWLEIGSRILVHEEGGFAVVMKGELKALAAHAPGAAAALLTAALREIPEGVAAAVSFITSGQDWAVPVVLDAGLTLRPAGAVMCRGDVGPMAPYLPSGSYL
jgi:GNAT superfamily N-acetyltransferase